jgi:hypothetical protein
MNNLPLNVVVMDGIEPPTQGFSVLIIWIDMA